MALPDTLERVGIVIGCILLVSLPVNALVSMLWGSGAQPSYLVYLMPVPGLVVGLLLAAGRFPLDYHETWQFAIASWLVAAVGATLLEIGPSSNPELGVAWWLVSIAVGIAVARIRFRELFSTDPESPTRDS
jgi:hypothetical protein